MVISYAIHLRLGSFYPQQTQYLILSLAVNEIHLTSFHSGIRGGKEDNIPSNRESFWLDENHLPSQFLMKLCFDCGKEAAYITKVTRASLQITQLMQTGANQICVQ